MLFDPKKAVIDSQFISVLTALIELNVLYFNVSQSKADPMPCLLNSLLIAICVKSPETELKS